MPHHSASAPLGPRLGGAVPDAPALLLLSPPLLLPPPNQRGEVSSNEERGEPRGVEFFEPSFKSEEEAPKFRGGSIGTVTSIRSPSPVTAELSDTVPSVAMCLAVGFASRDMIVLWWLACAARARRRRE